MRSDLRRRGVARQGRGMAFLGSSNKRDFRDLLNHLENNRFQGLPEGPFGCLFVGGDRSHAGSLRQFDSGRSQIPTVRRTGEAAWPEAGRKFGQEQYLSMQQ